MDNIINVKLSYKGDFIDHAGKPEKRYPGADNVWYGLPTYLREFLEKESLSTLMDTLPGDRQYKITIQIKETAVLQNFIGI